MKRTIIIGDIHGCFYEYKMLLEKVDYSKNQDRLILIGDLINKGPMSERVVEEVIENNIECVMGNHELRLLHEYDKKNFTFPSVACLKKYFKDDFHKVVEKIRNFPLFIEDENFIAVHAGVSPQRPISDISSDILTRIRTWDGKGKNLNKQSDPPWHKLYEEEKLIVYGHWASQGLCIKENTICLDSGCVYGGKLSAVILPERKIVQVDALKEHCPK